MKAVVLDFDGVLVRSMENHAEAYRRVLAPLGIRVSDEDIFAREGSRSETIIRDLMGPNAKPEEVARLSDEKQSVFQFLGVPPLYPGAAAMVRRLRAITPRLGLVTGTRRVNLDRFIPDLVPLFDSILTADGGYTHDKPHPEPYEKSAKALGVPPSSCAAIENAPLGVESARRAGYGLVVGITTTVAKARLAHAHAVVATHEDATAAIEAWLKA